MAKEKVWLQNNLKTSSKLAVLYTTFAGGDNYSYLMMHQGMKLAVDSDNE